jgi:hypothetical protein
MEAAPYKTAADGAAALQTARFPWAMGRPARPGMPMLHSHQRRGMEAAPYRVV